MTVQKKSILLLSAITFIPLALILFQTYVLNRQNILIKEQQNKIKTLLRVDVQCVASLKVCAEEWKLCINSKNKVEFPL